MTALSEKIEQAAEAVRKRFPDASVEDVRTADPDAIAALPEDVTLRPVQDTNLGRMKQATFNEMIRIEQTQLRLVEAGHAQAPSETQLALRDDFAGMVRLIERCLGDKDIMRRLTEAKA